MIESDMGSCPVCRKKRLLKNYHSKEIPEKFCSYECYIKYLGSRYKK